MTPRPARRVVLNASLLVLSGACSSAPPGKVNDAGLGADAADSGLPDAGSDDAGMPDDAGAPDACTRPTPVTPLTNHCTPTATQSPASFTIVSADPNDSTQIGAQVSELAQTFAPDQAGQAGSVSLTLELLSNTQLISTEADLRVDLYDLGPQPSACGYVLPEPTDTSGQCDNLEAYGASVAIARGRFNTNALVDGVATPVQINFTSAGTTATAINAEHAYALVLYMVPPGINRIGLPSQEVSTEAPALGFTYLRQEQVVSAGCISTASWVANGSRQLPFCMTVGDGCIMGDEYSCGTGSCAQTVPACDAYGNFSTCVPSCASASDAGG
jgi:hypothetical protein